jgi:RNA-directed DNA polymerase
MAKGGSMIAVDVLEGQETPVNIGDPDRVLAASARVLEIQAKLHRWAKDGPARRFDDLFNLVVDPAFLIVAWERVRNNKGARTAGVDGFSAYYVEQVRGVGAFLADLREQVRSGTFRPLPVRERMIPKANGKRRALGIPTVRDRVVQAALKLVLEPIFEADFLPCSYGFRPNRRAQDAVAEIHFLASRSYEWVLEGDIEACFDRIDHTALMARVRGRIGDKRVLALVKAFLKAGILTQDSGLKASNTGTPQGGILSPLLANIALSVLDEHVVQNGGAMLTVTDRARRKRHGLPNYRIIRYADDFVVMIDGTRDDAERIREQLADVLAPMGLRLSPEKTTVCHIDEGFEFLGWRIQRHLRRGQSERRFVYTYPSKKSVASVTSKVRDITRQTQNQPLGNVIAQLNALLRGWSMYFRHGASSRTFSYVGSFAWNRLVRWITRKHPRTGWRRMRRMFFPDWQITGGERTLFNPETIKIVRYRYRGADIPTPWEPRTA